MRIESFPHEIFLKIENEESFVGRIVINKIGKSYNAEIDIVNDETKKIFQHVDNLYNLSDSEDALEMAIQKLSDFLRKK